MRKVFLSLAALAFVATGSLTMTSCGGNDDSTPVVPNPNPDPNPDPNPIAQDNKITIDGEVYTATGSWFTVYGDQTTGEFANSYTWPAANLGIEQDLPVSEWNSYIIVEDESNVEYVLITGFDVPYVSSTTKPSDVEVVISYSQNLYAINANGIVTPALYEGDLVEFATFDTFAIATDAGLMANEQGRKYWGVSNYAFSSLFKFMDVNAPANFLGEMVALYVDPVPAQPKGVKVDRAERAVQAFDITRLKK